MWKRRVETRSERDREQWKRVVEEDEEEEEEERDRERDRMSE